MDIPKDYIKRYSTSHRATNIAAGVYLGVGGATHTPRFNLILTDIQVGLLSMDAVTSQYISSQARMEFAMVGGLNADNPGLIASLGHTPGVQGGSGRTQKFETYLGLSAGLALTLSYAVFLAAVTANAVNYDLYWTLGYLCPKDYLSVDVLD
ncbi:MAG: hypothetical protein KAI27_01710 [Rhodospirillaceae bacterium]|nr:hypothetical protein [Rhodospirillaceae bacterium]